MKYLIIVILVFVVSCDLNSLVDDNPAEAIVNENVVSFYLLDTLYDTLRVERFEFTDDDAVDISDQIIKIENLNYRLTPQWTLSCDLSNEYDSLFQIGISNFRNEKYNFFPMNCLFTEDAQLSAIYLLNLNNDTITNGSVNFAYNYTDWEYLDTISLNFNSLPPLSLGSLNVGRYKTTYPKKTNIQGIEVIAKTKPGYSILIKSNKEVFGKDMFDIDILENQSYRPFNQASQEDSATVDIEFLLIKTIF